MGGKHNLGISAIKNLPLQIADPIAITKNNQQNSNRDSIVLWINWIVEDGKGIKQLLSVRRYMPEARADDTFIKSNIAETSSDVKEDIQHSKRILSNWEILVHAVESMIDTSNVAGRYEAKYLADYKENKNIVRLNELQGIWRKSMRS